MNDIKTVSETARLMERVRAVISHWELGGSYSHRSGCPGCVADAALRDLEARIARWERIEEAARYFFLQWDRHFAEHLDDFIELALEELRAALAAETQGGER